MHEPLYSFSRTFKVFTFGSVSELHPGTLSDASLCSYEQIMKAFSPTHFPSVLSEGQPHGPDDLVCRASVEFDCCSSILPVCMYTVKKACAWLIFFPIQESVLYMFTKCLPQWFLWNCTGYGCSNKNMLAWAAWLFDDAVHHMSFCVSK